jgi:hypothetical protein
MSVTVGFLALLEAAKPDKADELAAFLEHGRELALAEPLTVDWYSSHSRSPARAGRFEAGGPLPASAPPCCLQTARDAPRRSNRLPYEEVAERPPPVSRYAPAQSQMLVQHRRDNGRGQHALGACVTTSLPIRCSNVCEPLNHAA